ncbi:MAG: HEAT repeat domain-containing protein, partial [Chloroflexi bacterium]|nr:HEAT repeat domain-containing protein [Chloroflexota bacterium]
GGMENTSATTLTDNVLMDERCALDYTADPLVSHELVHQWFGDLLTCKDWSHAWLNEGFATYFEAMWTERHLGIDEYRYEMYRNANIYLGEDSGRYSRAIVTRLYEQPIELFDRHLYEKGSLVLRMLRYVLGDDLFLKSIRLYARKHRGGVVGTEDLRQAIEETTGRTMESFFDQWLYKAGHPDLKVTYAWDDAAKLAQVTVIQNQQTDQETPLFDMPLVIDFRWDGGSQRFDVRLSEKEHRFHFPLPTKPLLVRFDPGDNILKSLDEDLPKEMSVYRLKHDDDLCGRIRAAKALAKVGAPDCIDALKDGVLYDKFWGVQSEAAVALGTIKSTAARDALIGCLSVQHPKARRAVVAALGEFHDDAVADAMIHILNAGDPSYFVEGEAAKTLGRTRSPKALTALRGALEEDSFMETIRVSAIDGLGASQDDGALETAKDWTKYGKPEAVRGAAMVAVAKLGETRKDTAEFLGDYLSDPMFRVRLRVAEALEALGDSKGAPLLEAQAGREIEGRARRRMREAAAAIHEKAKDKDELRRLRDDLAKVSDDNKSLRDRLDKLEAMVKNAVKPDKSA